MFKNGLYNLLGTIVRLGLSILSVPLLLKFLGSSLYGLYAILIAIINIAVLSEWSICMVLIVFIAQATSKSDADESSLEDTLWQSLILVIGLALCTSALLWLLSPWVSLAFPNLTISDKLTLQRGCHWAAIVVLFRLLQQYFIGIEQAYGEYKLLNSINTIFSISQTVLILTVANLRVGLMPIIGVHAVTTALFLGVHGFYCHQRQWLVPLKQVENRQWGQLKRMSMYMGRTFIGGIGSAFFSQGDRLIVGRLLGLEASGFYSALTSIATQIHTLSTIAIQPLISTLTKLLTQDGPSENSHTLYRASLKITISRALMINATLAVGLGSFIILFAPEIGSYLFKSESSLPFETSNTLKIIACIYTLYSLNAVGYYMLLAAKREIITTTFSLICGPFSLLMIGLLAYFYDIMGALIGNAGYLFTLFMLSAGFKSFQLQWPLWVKAVWQPLLVLLLISGASLFIVSMTYKVILLAFAFFILGFPLSKEGWQHVIISRKS